MSNKKFNIEVSNDKKRAYLSIFTDDYITKKEIFSELLEKKVIFGIKMDKIDSILKNRSIIKEAIIAEYLKPQMMVPPKLQMLINPKISPKLTKVKIDYYNLGYIKDVKKGMKIFSFTPKIESKYGILVDNSKLALVQDTKNLDYSILDRVGENIELKNKGKGTIEGFAKINGALLYSKNNIDILSTVSIKENLDFSVGNLISKYVSISIGGNVANSFEISTTKDVFVKKNIENSKISAFNLVVDKNINKGDKKIEITNNLIVNDISNRTNIYTHNLTSYGRVSGGSIGVLNDAVMNRISDTKIYIYNKLEIDYLGSETSQNTVIILGINKLEQDRFFALKKEMRKKRVELRYMRIEKVKVNNEIEELKAMIRKNTEMKDMYNFKIKRNEEDLQFLEEDIEKSEKEEIILLQKLNSCSEEQINRKSSIYVKKQLYPGTVIKFGNDIFIRIHKEYNSCKIYLDDEDRINIKVL